LVTTEVDELAVPTLRLPPALTVTARWRWQACLPVPSLVTSVPRMETAPCSASMSMAAPAPPVPVPALPPRDELTAGGLSPSMSMAPPNASSWMAAPAPALAVLLATGSVAASRLEPPARSIEPTGVTTPALTVIAPAAPPSPEVPMASPPRAPTRPRALTEPAFAVILTTPPWPAEPTVESPPRASTTSDRNDIGAGDGDVAAAAGDRAGGRRIGARVTMPVAALKSVAAAPIVTLPAVAMVTEPEVSAAVWLSVRLVRMPTGMKTSPVPPVSDSDAH